MRLDMQSRAWRRGVVLAWTGLLSMAGITLASAAIAAADLTALPPPAVDPVRIVLRPPAGAYNPAIPARIAADASVGEALKKLIEEHRCLSEAMYFEARGEGEAGQKAVAEVIFNRLQTGSHGRTICGVVYEGAGQAFCQFSYACDGSMDRPRDPEVWRAAQVLSARILAGQLPGGDSVDGATAYHSIGVRPNWGPGLQEVARVGNHIFYRSTRLPVLSAVFRGSLQ